MNEDNKSTSDNFPNKFPEDSSLKEKEENTPVPSIAVTKDDATTQSSSSDSTWVKDNPLSPKWWSQKSTDGNKAEVVALETSIAKDEAVDSAAPNSEAASLPPPVTISEKSEGEKEALTTSLPEKPAETVGEEGKALKTMSDIASKAIEKGKSPLSRFSTPPPPHSASTKDEVAPVVAIAATIATDSKPETKGSEGVKAEEGQILKTMSDVASKAIEKSKSSMARFEHLGAAKKPEDISSSIISEKVSSTTTREHFVTAAEKEARLKAIRDAAIQGIERKKALGEQKVSETVASVDEKKPEETATIAASVETVDTEVVVIPTEVSHHDLDTLVPPPPRPAGIFSQNKTEIRSAAQTRINEAYLRQLKGEGSAEDSSPSSSGKSNEDGLREVPLESLGTGVFNALGDMVEGVVNITRTLGNGIGKFVADNPTAKVPGTDKIALGGQGMLIGAKEIVKGGSNIVIGTVSMVTAPVAAVIKSIQSAAKSKSKEN
jgi:hypothetical protein